MLTKEKYSYSFPFGVISMRVLNFFSIRIINSYTSDIKLLKEIAASYSRVRLTRHRKETEKTRVAIYGLSYNLESYKPDRTLSSFSLVLRYN